jgi:RHS repeat-associated protein
VFCYDKQRGNTVFQYDPTGRILNAKGRVEEYFEFDPAGNMQPKGLGAFTVPGNRLEVFEDLRYEYDVHGNVSIRKKGAHEEAEFTWNAEHQLKEAKVTRKGTEQTTRYEYDALGRRTRKIDTFGATEYLWDGDLMIESRRNNKNALYLFEPRSFVPLATVQDNKTYWYQCDQVGAPQELTDREGNIVWAADYKVWGETTLRKTGTDGSARYSRRRQAEPSPVLEQPFRFQGQQFDEETGLHYNRYRYYDPGVGRFISQDPIGLRGGSNLFAYAPNPMGWVDPFGLAKEKDKPGCPSCEETVSVYKAPQSGKGADQYNNGYKTKDFCEGDQCAYFTKDKALADEYAKHYGEGVIELKVPKSTYNNQLKQFEYPYQGGPYTELPVPHSGFDALNGAERVWHK